MKQRFVIVSDSGESWPLNGDTFESKDKDDSNDVLPKFIEEGWNVFSVTTGSGSKDDTSYWLVLLTK